MIEKTLVLIKHDGVARCLTGEILARFEKVGLKIIGLKMVHVDKEFAKNHYPVTEKWFSKVGGNTLDDSRKYGVSAKETIGTEDPIEIGKKVHVWNIDYLTSGPVIAVVLEGVHAIETVRKMVGHTVPILSLPGTIRGDYANNSAVSSNIRKRAIYNLIHASADREDAEREIKLWFKDAEILHYKSVHEMI